MCFDETIEGGALGSEKRIGEEKRNRMIRRTAYGNRVRGAFDQRCGIITFFGAIDHPVKPLHLRRF
jgi:hypothetical protein